MNSIDKIVYSFNKEYIQKVFANSHCKSAVAKSLNIKRNSHQLNEILDKFIKLYDIDISHFDRKFKHKKYSIITKYCPVCNVAFKVKKGIKKEKQTCSRACSNTFFRSGKNNGNYKNDNEVAYQTVCWRYHKRKCIICNEKLIVEAHHYNDNHNDNKPENFAPLCPTHHQYWHSKYRYLIQDSVDNYVKLFTLTWQNGRAPLS